MPEIARELARLLKPGDRILLEGPMGVGKSTFAREILLALGVHQPPEGSPTFAIAHEYTSPRGAVVHMDLYRIETEEELEHAGIYAYFWEREIICLTEWLSNWQQVEKAMVQSTQGGSIYRVELAFSDSELRRNIRIKKR